MISALIVAVVFMLPWAIFGLFVTVKMMLPKCAPMDQTNRINHIRLLWFVLTRPELFVGTFPWLAKDELDNIKK